jgi:hypothetical protein
LTELRGEVGVRGYGYGSWYFVEEFQDAQASLDKVEEKSKGFNEEKGI